MKLGLALGSCEFEPWVMQCEQLNKALYWDSCMFWMTSILLIQMISLSTHLIKFDDKLLVDKGRASLGTRLRNWIEEN